MMWSKTLIPMALPASISCFVALMSSWLGCGSPMGGYGEAHRIRGFLNRKPEDLARVEHTAIKRAFKDGSLRDHLAPFQSVASSPALPVVVTPPLVSKASTTAISFVRYRIFDIIRSATSAGDVIFFFSA